MRPVVLFKLFPFCPTRTHPVTETIHHTAHSAAIKPCAVIEALPFHASQHSGGTGNVAGGERRAKTNFDHLASDLLIA